MLLFTAISDPTGMSVFDIPMAVMFFVSGLVVLGLRKQQATARFERVKKGELTESEAKKRNRDWSLSGYTFIALGLGLAISHYLSI
jgi:hypothetical protein